MGRYCQGRYQDPPHLQPSLGEINLVKYEGVVKGGKRLFSVTCCTTIKRIMIERVALYRRVPPPLGETTPVSVEHFTLKNFIPEEAEIM